MGPSFPEVSNIADLMEYAEYLDAVETAAQRIAGRGVSSVLTVPSCPGWTTSDLLAHVVNVLRQKLPVMRDRLTVAPAADSWQRVAPTDPELPSTLLSTAGEVVTLLTQMGPDVELWSWYERDHSSSFWARRLAHELAIHCADSELAAGLPPGCDAQLAADGVGELATVFLDRPGRQLTDDGPDALLHLHGTDIPCEWSVELSSTGMSATPGHSTLAQAELRAPVVSLYLWGWGRRHLEGIEVNGDQGLPARLRQLAAKAT